MPVSRLGLLACALMAALSLPVVHGQSLNPFAERFVAANDSERLEMVWAHAEISTPEFRRSISTPAVEAFKRGDLDLAARYQNAVLWLGEHFKDDTVRAAARTNLASINGQRGDFFTAQQHAQQALIAAERAANFEGVQSASATLGIIQRRLGDTESALASFARALDLAEQLDLQENAARVLNNIGLAHADLGDLASAREYLDRSLALKTSLNGDGRLTQDIATSLNNIGTLYQSLGDFPQARSYFERALTSLQGLEATTPRLNVWSNLGHVHMQLGEAAKARELFQRVLADAEVRGERPRVANSVYLLGLLDRDAGRFADAEAQQRRALALREQVGAPQPIIESLVELSRLVLQRGAAEEAHALASRASSLASERRLREQLWDAQAATADSAAALSRPNAAIELYQASIAGVETLRALTGGGDRSRQIFMGLRPEPYLGLARVHARAGRAMDGLAAIERARSRTLLDVMASGRRVDRWLTEPQRSQERALTAAVRSAASELDVSESRSSTNRERVAVLEAKLARARLERDAFTTALYASTPDLQIARGDTAPVTAADLASLVGPTTAVMSLVLDNTSAWIYLISRSAAGVAVTAHQSSMPAASLVSLANEFATQVAARDLGFAVNARRLYDALFIDTKIEPMLKGKSRLIIVPDGPLWRVPFQALRTPRDTYLIEERAVSYAPSMSALAALERRQQSRTRQQPFLLALGDPAIRVGGDAAERRGRAPQGRLPQAAREVRAIGQVYGESRSHVLVGERASESALRAHLGKASVLHIATHGVVDDLSPLYSHLLLSPRPGAANDDDGRLEAWELMNHALEADLVVLSACETARGPVGDGEGVIGMSWSLFAAGASTAVVSQWEVDSASTTALMIAFHERLLIQTRNGRGDATVAEALRVAAARLMRDPAYRHPFYWAGFVVIGAS